MARLFSAPGERPKPVQTEVSLQGLRVLGDGINFTLSYGAISGAIGGFEDAWIVIKSSEQPGMELWLEPEILREIVALGNKLPLDAIKNLVPLVQEHGKRGKSRLFIRGGLVLLVLLIVGWAFSGGLLDMAVAAIPQSLEVQLGKLAAEGMTKDYEICVDEGLEQTVQEVLDRLVAELPPSGYEFEVTLLRSEEVNAFALPGGQLFFFSGLLAEAGSVDEVAAVMGHELQHVMLQHGLRGMVRSAGMSGTLMLVLGDASEALALLGGYAVKLGGLKMGRDAERDADSLGMKTMARAGFDPQGAVDFFGHLAELSGDSGGAFDRVASIVQTHPASSERTERLQGMVEQLEAQPIRPIDVDWIKLRAGCGESSHQKQADGADPETEASP